MCALRLADRIGYGRAFATSLALSTGAPLFTAILPGHGTTLAVALGAVQFVAGTGLGSANVLSVTMRQLVAPRGSLARTNGGYRLLNFGVIPLGSAAGGVIGQAAGSRAGVAIGRVGLAVSALPMLTRRIRTMRTPAQAAERTGGGRTDRGGSFGRGGPLGRGGRSGRVYGRARPAPGGGTAGRRRVLGVGIARRPR